jgi:hypothetical protein
MATGIKLAFCGSHGGFTCCPEEILLLRGCRELRRDGVYPRVVNILVFDRLEQFVESFGILANCRSRWR